ncbi:GTPase domain-containing protein [Vibrio coralliirubri]|uniref:GTPase domain-containing protein n=1 Tax=Vibrio coralliirubri TaxID=1516159 RepID=UPI0021C3A0EE|nr:GTPase domain-containing protein [Vibrio coralliirubri]
MTEWTMLLSAVKAPYSVYKNWGTINKWYKKLLVWANKGETNVVVTGAAGAGKTELTNCLHGEIKNHDYQEPKTSQLVERHAISIGEMTRIYSVIPGQDIAAREQGLNEAFNKHKGLEGVVHLVDYGFTTNRSTVVEEALIADGVETIEQIREYNRKNELDEFKRVCDRIAASISDKKGPKWLVIAVNKSDLYLDTLNDAQRYYDLNGSSLFVDEISKLQKRVGTQNLKCYVVPVCTRAKPFIWNNIEVTPKLETFQESTILMRNLVQTIAEADND